MANEGSIIDALPDSPIPGSVLESLEDHPRIHATVPIVARGTSEHDDEIVSEFVLQTDTTGVIATYENGGWRVVRKVNVNGRDPDDVLGELMGFEVSGGENVDEGDVDGESDVTWEVEQGLEPGYDCPDCDYSKTGVSTSPHAFLDHLRDEHDYSDSEAHRILNG